MKQFGCTIMKVMLTTVAFLMDFGIVSEEIINYVTDSGSNVLRMILRILYSVEDKGILNIVLAVVVFAVYKYAPSFRQLKTGDKILGVLMALTCLFGRAFDEFGSTAVLAASASQIAKTVIAASGYILFFPRCVCVVKDLVSGEIYKHNEMLNRSFDINDPARYRRMVWLLLIVIWGIWAVAYYPGMFTGDTEDIIYMAYNYHTGIADTVQLISQDVQMVDHHSVLYTLILGFFVKMGRGMLGSENLGMFVYTVLQLIFTAWVLAYSLYKLKIYNVSPGMRNIILLFFAFFPWIPKYAVRAAKDTMFADFLMLYLLLVMDMVEEHSDKIRMDQVVRGVVYAVLIFLLRKNGIYVVILSLPFLLMMNKKWIKPVFFMLVLIFLAKFVYSDIILPKAQIPDGSISAALSIPLQQTSRYLKYYGGEVTEEEKAAIDAVADYEELSTTYWADRSDWAKAAWRKEALSDDIKNYFTVWGKMFLKHPLTYVAATANNYYGYFYPVVIDMHEFERANSGGIASVNSEGYFNFKEADNKVSAALRYLCMIYDSVLMKIPVINLICTSAVYVWLLIFTWVHSIVKKDKRLLMLVIPMLMLMLTILAGPCNGNIYHRFTYPIAMCVPVIAGYGLRLKKEEEHS